MTINNIVQEASVLCGTGNISRAEELCQQVLTVEPQNLRALAIIGVIRCQQGHEEEGIRLLEQVVKIKPDYAAAWANLGKAYLDARKLNEALNACTNAIRLNAALPLPYSHLGTVYRLKGDLKQAVTAYRNALAIEPAMIPTYIELGIALRLQKRFVKATEAYQTALKLNPSLPEAYYNLGNVFADQQQWDEAIIAYRTALQLNSDYYEPALTMGNLCLSQGLVPEALAYYRKALALGENCALARSNLIYAMNYDPTYSDEELFSAHREWDYYHALPVEHRTVSTLRRQRDKVLCIGYVSADFKQHPVGSFLIPIIPAHDRSKFVIFCYNQATTGDAITGRFRQVADFWRDIYDLDDDTVADMIRADGIDILIDLSGHTGNNRLPVFARKPAPIQMTWAGYVGTTGMSAMDYLISDKHESPDGSERFCVEKIIRLPHSYVCFEPPAAAPLVGASPVLANGVITFGCFNNLAKITPEVISLWCKVMTRIPGSRIILKTTSLGSATVQHRFMTLFRDGGIDPARVTLLGGSLHRELLDTYNKIDIALDPFPYSGGLTTLEALWMGVPVVTLGGSRFCSRHSITHLTTAGLSELIATSADDYIRITTNLAHDVKRLGKLRRNLRNRVANSPLCDGKQFTRNLEVAFTKAWHRWCDGEKPENIAV